MKFYVGSGMKNAKLVEYYQEKLKEAGWEQTYNWVKNINNDIDIDEIREYAKLEQEGMTFSREKYEKAYMNMVSKFHANDIDYNDPFCIAQISNFNKLIAISNETSTPIFDINLNNPTDGQLRTLGWFKKLYGAMAERIIELTDEE